VGAEEKWIRLAADDLRNTEMPGKGTIRFYSGPRDGSSSLEV